MVLQMTHLKADAAERVAERALHEVGDAAWQHISDWRDELIGAAHVGIAKAIGQRREVSARYLIVAAVSSVRDEIARELRRRGWIIRRDGTYEKPPHASVQEIKAQHEPLTRYTADDATDSLDERERAIIDKRIAGYTLREIATHLQVSYQRIYQLHSRARQRATLRKQLHDRQPTRKIEPARQFFGVITSTKAPRAAFIGSHKSTATDARVCAMNDGRAFDIEFVTLCNLVRRMNGNGKKNAD